MCLLMLFLPMRKLFTAMIIYFIILFVFCFVFIIAVACAVVFVLSLYILSYRFVGHADVHVQNFLRQFTRIRRRKKTTTATLMFDELNWLCTYGIYEEFLIWILKTDKKHSWRLFIERERKKQAKKIIINVVCSCDSFI